MVAKIVRPDIALGSAVRTEGVANTFVSTKLPATIVDFLRVTAAGMRESHAHDVQIIKEAPNYHVD